MNILVDKEKSTVFFVVFFDQAYSKFQMSFGIHDLHGSLFVFFYHLFISPDP